MPESKFVKTDAESLQHWAEIMQDPHSTLMQKIAFIALDMDLLKNPEDAIAERAAATEDSERREKWTQRLDQYMRGNFASLVQEVAQQTGADPAQIANKETRTPEQQQALLEASARRQIERMDAFFDSDYMRAVRALDEVDSPFAEPTDPDEISVKESFILYYFTTRPDIRPSTTGTFTQADKDALIAQYRRFEAFIIEYFGSVDKAEAAQREEWQAALEAFIAAENPTDAQEIIEHLSSVLPEKYVAPNNKLANTLTKGIVDIGKITLEVSKTGSKKLVETTCILTYEGDNVKLSGRQPFTEYDRNVYNAVSSLYVYGDASHVVTPAMVYRAMTGMTETEKPTAQQIAAVTKSLDKMRFIRARINCTEELKARRVTLNSRQINGGEIDTYLLTAEAIKVQAGGHTVTAYRIIKTPILYEYAAAVKQVLTLPASMLDVKEIDSTGRVTTRSLPNTEARILIKGYLLRRIEGMKGKNALNNPVIALYDYQKDGETHEGLYSIAGNPEPTRTEANRIRADAEKMLAYWRTEGYIKGFEAVTERKRITGYKISV